jgi:hypothetical protein
VEQIVKESVLLIPHLVVAVANAVHGVGDPGEMLDETVGKFLVHGVVVAQNERNLKHALAVESHPCGYVSSEWSNFPETASGRPAGFTSTSEPSR